MKLKIILFILAFCIKVLSQSDFWENKLALETSIQSIAFDSYRNIYVGKENDGIHKSTDNGKTWERKFFGLPRGSIECIAINSNDIIFCGVSFSGHLVKGPDPLGVFRSTDFGETWELVYESIWIQSIIIDSYDYIYVCGNTFNLITDVVFSKDNGQTWEKIEDGLPKEFVTEMIMDNKENLYITRYEGGLYKSANKGKKWDLLNNQFRYKGFEKILSSSKGTLFAMIDSVGLFKSFNEGINWIKIFNADDEDFLYDFTVNNNDDVYLAKGDFYSDSTNSFLLLLKNEDPIWDTIATIIENRIINIITIDKEGHLLAGMIKREKDFIYTPVGYELYKSKNIYSK